MHWRMETQVFKRLKKFWAQKQCIRIWQILKIPSLPTFWKSPCRIKKLNSLKILLLYMLYFLSKIHFKFMSFLYDWSIFLKLFLHWSQQQFLYSALLTRINDCNINRLDYFPKNILTHGSVVSQEWIGRRTHCVDHGRRRGLTVAYLFFPPRTGQLETFTAILLNLTIH
jgi:hypothetical protein